MRQNHAKVINALLDGRIASDRNLFTMDGSLFHHSTCIATSCDTDKGIVWIVNVTQYSKTTSTLRNALLAELSNRKNVLKVDGLPKLVTANEMRELAKPY